MLHFTIPIGDIEGACQQAEHIVKGRIQIQRYTGTPIEARGYAAHFDRISAALTLWASTQQPHPLRTILAAVLGTPEGKIRVIQTATGGAFGLKTPPYQEEPVICLLSRLTGKPVKWIEDRGRALRLVHGGDRDRHRAHRCCMLSPSDCPACLQGFAIGGA